MLCISSSLLSPILCFGQFLVNGIAGVHLRRQEVRALRRGIAGGEGLLGAQHRIVAGMCTFCRHLCHRLMLLCSP